MTSVLEGEKQLFEKFWRGTFKAVAMPRPESVIIASITARRAVTKLETSVCLAPKPCEVKPELEKPAVKMTERKTRVKHRGHKHRSHHHSHSGSLKADISTWPSAKRKKKKNSKRKRGRERSPSSSPSPLRKKKKKKKSSKKRKQHRSASKKMQHSTSNNRRKRKENRKHKKRSRSDSHHRHRSRKTDRSPGRRSIGPQNRSEDHKTNHPTCPLGDQRRFDWRTAVKLANKTSSRCYAMMSECSVKCLRPGLEALNQTAIVQDSLSNQVKGHADYDSGNDTSSPPSSKTGMMRAKVVGGRMSSCQELVFPEKLRLTNRDNGSDSGNSVTSYDSACEGIQAESGSLSRAALRSSKREESRSCGASRTVQHPAASGAGRSLTPSHSRYRSETRSRSRSRSSRSSRYRDSSSRSRSLSSSHRSYCRSSSYSLDSRRGSVCNTSSERRSRYVDVRSRGSRAGRRCRKQSGRERKRNRRRFSSPVRKRRRGSPSHLEARRITSARKRPIPYYRPSPSSRSSSSRCSSLSSWSLFSLIRSRSPSCTQSSSRSHSHASSWNSAYSSRSRSYDSLASYSRARR